MSSTSRPVGTGSLLHCVPLLCLALGVLLLSGSGSGRVQASNAYGTLFGGYTCPYATSLAFYGAAPNSYYLSCYGTGLVKVTTTSTGGYNILTAGGCLGSTQLVVNPASGLAYAACALSGGIVSWDTSSGSIVTTIATTSQCIYPSSVAVNQFTNTVYAACGFGGGVISIVNGGTPSVVLTAAQCPTATAVAVDPNSGVAYAACTGVGVLLLRAGAAPLTLAGTSVCPNPQSLTVHYFNDVLYAVCASYAGHSASLLTIIGSIVQSYPLGTCMDPRGVAVNSYGDQIFVACGTSGGVVALDPLSTTLTTIVPPSACRTASDVTAPYSFGTTGVTYMYATCATPSYDTEASSTPFAYNFPGSVIGIDLKTTVLATSADCPNAGTVAVDNYQNVVYAGCGSGAGILAFNGYTGGSTVIANTSQCNSPQTLAFAPNQATLYAGCSSQGGITSLHNPNPNGAFGLLPYTATSFIPSTSCSEASAMTIDQTHSQLYAGCQTAEFSVSIYNSASISNFGNVACSSPTGMAVNINTVPPTVYTTCGASNVVLNGSAVLLNNAAICSNPQAVVVGPTNGIVYVACYGNSAIIGILPNGTISTIANSAQCRYPNDLAVHTFTGVVYASCFESGIFSITTTNPTAPFFAFAQVLQFTYCQYPLALAVNPNTVYMYAICSNAAQAVISIYLS